MARRLLSRAGGFVHDITTVAALSDQQNNIRLLSDRSLYILQNLSQEDVTFLSRYGEMLGGDFYLPVLSGSPEESDVENAKDLIRRDLNDMAVEDLLECICQAIGLLAEQGQVQLEQGSAEGTTSDVPPSDGTVVVGPGEKFPTQEAYYDAKCNAANGIFDTILVAIDWLDDNHADLLAGQFGGVTTGLIAALVAAGPVGWGTVLAASTVAGIATLLIRYSLDFGDVSDALGEQHEECVKALYNGGNTIQARDGFMIELDNAATSTTLLEQELVGFMLSNSVLNQLFDIGDSVVSYDSPGPIVCGGFLQRWQFVASGESWAFRDDSTGTYSASGAWNSGTEAWRISLVGLGTPTGPQALGRIFLTGLAVAVAVGNSVQFDHGASSDNVITGRNIKVVFSDASEQYYGGSATKDAGTLILSIASTKTIAEIEIGFNRNWSSPFSMYRDVTEVRIV